MKKRILSFLTLLCMVTALLPTNVITVSAYNGTKYGDYLYYTESNGEITITDCDDSATEIVIPSEIDGKKVTSIGYYAFYKCESLGSVMIPDGVICIGLGAFSDCKALTSVTIPDSVTSIDSGAFYNTGIYNNVSDVLYIGNYLICAKTSLSGEYTVKSGTTHIADSAFKNCEALTDITIPDSVINIGESAFYGCEALTNVTIPNSVTNIGESAFYNCEALTNIIIPDSVTSISDYTFSLCSGLTSITIPIGVTSIGNYAFYECRSLTSITLPKSITTINYSTFDGCSNLKNVYYNGTKTEWDKIYIPNSYNDFTNANRIYFAYINILDKDGNKVIGTTQNMGEAVDVSSIKVPDGYKLVLYKDREMQQEYDSSEPIKENLTLYAHFAETISKIQTTVSDNCAKITVTPINIANGSTVILALYNGEEFITMKSAVYSGKDIPFTITDDYTTAKVMVWNNLDDIMPICDIEIIKHE